MLGCPFVELFLVVWVMVKFLWIRFDEGRERIPGFALLQGLGATGLVPRAGGGNHTSSFLNQASKLKTQSSFLLFLFVFTGSYREEPRIHAFYRELITAY